MLFGQVPFAGSKNSDARHKGMSYPSRNMAPQLTWVDAAGPQILARNHRFLSSNCG